MKIPRFLLTFAIVMPTLFAEPSPPHRPQVIAYVFPQNSVLEQGQINGRALTRINYAFANIHEGRIVAGYPNDTSNLAVITGLRKDNPSLTVLISVGGWLWSGQFSEAARTEENRQKFIDSAVEFIRLNELDGLDIDWEYPGMPGSGHPFRSDDGPNFTILLRQLRARFDKEARTGPRLYLTIAVGASDDFLVHTQMAEAQKFLDTVNLMAYDYYEPGAGPITGHHAPLFTNPADPLKVSADASIRAFEAAGVPAQKLVLGVPFYGHMWGEVADLNNGLFQPGKSIPNAYAPFSLIDSKLLHQDFVRYWDSVSSVPWLYSPHQHIFVSYEDEQSLSAKCEYLKRQHLGGIMFWSYGNDSDGKLLNTIDDKLK